jgi:hypothetical protein
MARGLLLSSASACLLAACGPDFDLTPRSGSGFGNYAVTAKGHGLGRLKEPIEVHVGGVAAYDIARVDSHTLQMTLQGAPKPGVQQVLAIDVDGNTATGTFDYRGPVDPRFARLVGFGASLSQGAQDLSIKTRGQLKGPIAQLARAMGAYFTMPLMKEGILPSLLPGDFDPTTCRPTMGSLDQIIQQRGFDQALPKLVDWRGDLHVEWVRVDPEVEVRNVAIGGLKISEVLNGPGDVVGRIFEHLIWDPFVPESMLLDAPKETEIDRVVAMKPTIAVTTDLFANDFLIDFGGSGIPDLTGILPLEMFDQILETILSRIEATGAEIFVGTCPDVTLTKDALDKVAALRAAGSSDADATGWAVALRQQIATYNDHLKMAAAGHPRLHVVDLDPFFNQGLTHGFDVAGIHLDPNPFGGLLSLDGQHFSDTGYALLAEEYVKAINAQLGAHIPDIDVAAALADDPYSVAHLREMGFTCAGSSN